ncbi:MAG TPA: SGNH/GDSL hydrolase family protein [Solirubrobacteraceae bacterium]|nr:SGNH/GDSL hydrolase family protein [Solirubrobacteraceae bacterium]
MLIFALGLVFAMTGTALAKKHKHKPKKPSITPHTAITKGSRYLALGDSVTFGYEEQQVVPAPNYGDASSFIAYPELLGKELHLTVANAACSGETSSSLIDATAQSNGCENSPGGGPGYRTNFPLHVNYSGSQLAYAVSYLKKHKNVRLVSLMIGANDFFVCQETTADKCSSFGEQAGVIGTVEKNVATILTAIRKQAKYNGQIVIVNYYALTYADPTAVQQSQLLNSSIDNAARPFHVEFADGFGQFGTAAAHSGGNSCTAGLLTQLSGVSSPCGIHPSYAGQSLLAQAVANAIRIG